MQLRLPWGRGNPNPNENENNRNENENEIEMLQEIELYGDPIADKLDGLVRIGFQNVNGITKTKELVGMEELEAMNEMKFDLVGMIETNVNWTHDVRNALHTASGLRFNNTARCVMSNTSAKTEGYLPGGTAMVSQGKFSG